ncbi:murein hydrolase activator EnvC family protein [Actinopolyspora xinjiangensis]|nr:M23 family metallopeptidase [Actinopolyspora xinjiangensis]
MRGWAVALLLTLGTGAVAASGHGGPPSEPTNPSSPRGSPRGPLRDPLRGPAEVLRDFRKPRDRYAPGHRGVDLLAHPRQEVLAAAAGTVGHAGFVVDRHVIAVNHGDGLSTTYEPVLPEVAAGQRVARGEVIGHVTGGHPECPAKPPNTCLHWGVRDHDAYLDPLGALPTGGVRLLPWRASEAEP